MSQNGKGSQRRPQQISNKQMDRNWDDVFKQRKKQPSEEKDSQPGDKESKKEGGETR